MRLGLVLLTTLLIFTPANASSRSPEEQAMALSEAAIGEKLPSLTFIDTESKKIDLDTFRGKPVLISLIYTGCTDVCPLIIENLRPAIEAAQAALGEDSFTTITIGFNTKRDTPDRMRSFARERGIDLPNWLFLSGKQRDVEKLAKATGFSIVPSAGGFDHTAQVSVIDPEGKIYQQIRGGVFGAPVIVEPLKDLLFGQRRSILSIEGITERIKLFCTVYNPNTGRYYFNYSLFIGLFIGLASLLLILTWLIREYKISGRSGGGTHP
ncbi:MAG: SCO family protein [Rhizobiaceae bacterium]